MDTNSLCSKDEDTSEDKTIPEEVTRIQPEKVLAPFLKTLKRRKKFKADAVPQELKEFFSRRNPYELQADLEESFADPLKLVTVLNETAELLSVVTSSKNVNLYLVDYGRGIITLCPKYLQENERFYARYRIGPGKTLAAYVAHTKEYVITRDVLGDSRFPEGIPGADKMVKAALCLPVVSNLEEVCIAIVELYRDLRQPAYDTVNLQIAIALCGWAGVGVQQNMSSLKAKREIEIHRYLFSIAQTYFENIFTFDKAISDLIVFSKTFIKADKCTFYLMNKSVPFGSEELLLAEVYEEAFDESEGLAVYRKKMKASFPYLKPGVAGYAARSGEVIAIKDAYEDERFDMSSDPPNYRTRSLLVTPIKNNKGVIGVLTLANKLTELYFTEGDISSLEMFSNYAALICEYREMQINNKQENLKLEIEKELLFIHTKPPLEDFNSFKALPVLNSHQMPPGFFNFDWSIIFYEDEIPKYVMFAFLGSGLIKPIFDQNNMISFALSVKKSCRPVFYHNFEHAFIVFHFLFNVLYRNAGKFSLNETVSLLIAGLCHNLDHRGVTNSFLELKNDPIAELYEEFPQEEHHFNVCLLLIQANNLLLGFSPEDYKEITNEIHRLILATNLSFFFRFKKEIVNLLNEDAFDWNNPEHRHLTKGFLMTCGEYSANFRNFDYIRKNTENFYRELFIQGDQERTMGMTPIKIMDRTQISAMPDYHLVFLTTVVEPCTEIVADLFPNCQEIILLCKDGLEKWKELIALQGIDVWKQEESLSKEKKIRGPRYTAASTLSSVKSMQSDQKNGRLE